MKNEITEKPASVIPFARPPRHGTEAMPYGRPYAPTIPRRVWAGMRVADFRLRMLGPPGGYLPFIGSSEGGVDLTVHEPGPLRPVYLCVAWQEATKLVLAYGCGITDESARDAARFHLDRKWSADRQAARRPGLEPLDGVRGRESRPDPACPRNKKRSPTEVLTHA